MSNSNTKPTHSASTKTGSGDNVKFENVGVAWLNDDGKVALKLYGTQIVSGTIYINPITQN
jgi:hypothetical protein